MDYFIKKNPRGVFVSTGPADFISFYFILFCHILFFHPLQFRQYQSQHGDKAEASADYVRYRLSEEDTVGSHVERIRHQIGERHNNKYFAEQGEKDRLFLLNTVWPMYCRSMKINAAKYCFSAGTAS